MTNALEHLIPVLGVIAVGWFVGRIGLIDAGGRAGVDRLAYFVLFPCLIVLTLSTADFGALPWQALGATLFLSVVTMAALCLCLYPVLSRRLGVSGPSFTSVFQGATRWNTFIALAISGSLFGTTGLTLVAVAIVAMVPALNLMAVIVLVRFSSSTRPPFLVLIREIARNPLIVACVIGLALNLTGLVPVGPIKATLEIFGRAALAVALAAVGLGLDVNALRRPKAVHLVGVSMRLIIMPLIGAVYAAAFGLSGDVLSIAVIALSVPAAANAYLLAKQLGGDANLMAELITMQTIGAAITMPFWLAVLANI